MKLKHLSCIIIFLISCTWLNGQEVLKSNEEEYYDFLALQGITEYPTYNYRTLSDSEWMISDEFNHPYKKINLGSTKNLIFLSGNSDNFFAKGINPDLKLKIYGPEWFNSYNTRSPYGQNDGGLWQGKGYNTAISAGIRLEGFGFQLTFKPQLSWTQNQDFNYRPGTYGDTHSYFWIGNIDLVQRYGDNSFWNFDFGDTEARFNFYNFTLGFGFQSPWLGPAYLNPMLGSNNSGTYPKVDFGLKNTKIVIPFINWDIGNFEGRIWTGRLTASDYFYPETQIEDRMLHGISLSYQPSFVPGLFVGVNRIFLTYWRTENLKYIGRLFTLSRSNALSSSGNDEDQKCALNIGWRLPKVGFEVYGEFGIDDFTSEEIANPFHTGIYTVGGKQSIPLAFSKISRKFHDVSSEFIFEWSNFEMSQDFQLQWKYIGYYGHGFVKEGYTQKGQIIGAGYCYGGNSQFGAWKFFHNKGYIMPYFHRYCPDNNYIWNMSVNTGASSTEGKDIYHKHYGILKTNLTFGIRQSYYITADLCLDAEFAANVIWFETWEKEDGINSNFRFEVSGKYNF